MTTKRRRPKKKHAARRANPSPKRKPAKKRKQMTEKQGDKRFKRKAKRKDNPSHAKKKHARKRKKNFTAKQGDKRYTRKAKRKPRKDNPHGRRTSHKRRSTHKRKRNMTASQAGKRYARRRRHHRNDNPLGLRLGNPVGQWGNIVALGVASLGGYIAAEFLDRFVATRAGGKSPNGGKDAFTGAGAMIEINAPPDGMRLAAQGGLALVFLVGGFWAAKKKHDTIAYIATGAGIGAGLHVAAQIWYDNIVPMFAKSSKDPKKPSFLGDRIYPDLDADALKAASEKAKALRTAGHSTLGAPQQTASNLSGSPRVVARPAPTVGCGGMDFSQMAMIQQLRQQNEALTGQLSRRGITADGPELSAGPEMQRLRFQNEMLTQALSQRGIMADGPESRPARAAQVGAPQPQPQPQYVAPQPQYVAPPQPQPDNVSHIQKRLAAFA